MKCGGFWIACLFHYASVWDYGKLILIHRKGKMVVININFIKRLAPNFVQVRKWIYSCNPQFSEFFW